MPARHRLSRVQFKELGCGGSSIQAQNVLLSFSSDCRRVFAGCTRTGSAHAQKTAFRTFLEKLKMNSKSDWQCFGVDQKVYEKRV